LKNHHFFINELIKPGRNIDIPVFHLLGDL
jgi:hypothetical protein